MQNSKINIRQTTVSMCEVAVCAALLCVLSPLSIPTPFGVGFTLQVLIVLLTALILFAIVFTITCINLLISRNNVQY